MPHPRPSRSRRAGARSRPERVPVPPCAGKRGEVGDRPRSTGRRGARLRTLLAGLAGAASLLAAACGPGAEPADLILTNGAVYTLSWSEPARDGTPAADAPVTAGAWRPDAEAVAMRGGEIVYVGDAAGARDHEGEGTRVVDVDGATVLPGLVDSHTHVDNLGTTLAQVDLEGVETEEEAVERVAARAARVPQGEWIVGWGWDEGAWAGNYPDWELLNRRVPDHPVVLRSLHSFAIWGNRMAFREAGITPDTEPPTGGEIVTDARGSLTGILMNRATELLMDAIPDPDLAERKRRLTAGLEEMARSGYVAVHEAGVDSAWMDAYRALAAEDGLPLRVYAMLSARDTTLLARWLERGPDGDPGAMLRVRSVKAFYDGALGSRGARLLEDYSDRPGHRGVSGESYGFDEAWVRRMIHGGFQVAIHAIGTAGNRETLDYLESVLSEDSMARSLRHRVEHAQVVHPDDVPRFGELGLVASMEPPHAVEDKAWAEERLGPERIRWAYAWRTLREAGAELTLNSDLPGSDWDPFYGLHAAVTRRDRERQPPGGWYPAESLTAEEAVRGYTKWSAYAAFAEDETGVLAPGRWADVTVMDVDPFVVGSSDAPGRLLDGRILLTVVDGEIVHDGR